MNYFLEFLESVTFTILCSLGAFVIGLGIAFAVNNESIARDCEKLGGTRINGSVYECHLKVNHE